MLLALAAVAAGCGAQSSDDARQVTDAQPAKDAARIEQQVKDEIGDPDVDKALRAYQRGRATLVRDCPDTEAEILAMARRAQRQLQAKGVRLTYQQVLAQAGSIGVHPPTTSCRPIFDEIVHVGGLD